MGRIKVFTDGASRGNPGHSGIGIVIYDENNFILKTYKEYIGEATNNQAEYRALIKSLELIKKWEADNQSDAQQVDLRSHRESTGGGEFDSMEFYLDSELVVNQINFDYRVKEPDLALLNNKFHVIAKKLKKPYSVYYIERSGNKNADRLANLAIDSKFKS